MAFDLQALAVFSSILAVLLLWFTVYFIKSIVRLVSESIHDTIRWELLYAVLFFVLAHVAVSFYSIYANVFFYDPSIYLLRTSLLFVSAFLLMLVTQWINDASLLSRLPLSMKLFYGAAALLGLFFSVYSSDSTYIPHHVLLTLSFAFLGVSAANIGLYAGQFEQISKIYAVLMLLSVPIFVAGAARAFFYSSYSPVSVPGYSNALLNFAFSLFFVFLAVVACYAIGNLKDKIAEINVKRRKPGRQQLTRVEIRGIISRLREQ